MVETLMTEPRKKATRKAEGLDTNEKTKERAGEGSLKVTLERYDVVSDIAKMRRKSVKELFLDEDVKEFFDKILLIELAERSEGLQKKRLQ